MRWWQATTVLAFSPIELCIRSSLLDRLLSVEGFIGKALADRWMVVEGY
jgi:hypothetical protein